MIDFYAGFLRNMERYRSPLAPGAVDLASKETDFETELLYAMSQPMSNETSYEKLNRLYPNWVDLLEEHKD